METTKIPQFSFELKGFGTQDEIIKALKLVLAAFQDKSVRESLDSPEIENLDGTEWLDCSFITNITKAN